MSSVAILPRAGTSPLGFFVVSPGALGPPSPLLADNIDPFSHDFASLTTGIDPIDAQVLLALTVIRDSGPSVTDTGIQLTETKILPSIQVILRSAVQQALATLIANRDIRLVSVFFGEDGDGVDPANQVVNFSVRWINLRALDGTFREASVPITSTRGGA